MTGSKEKRNFSAKMRDANSAFLPSESTQSEPTHVGFILQKHFSMMAFTAAVDAIVTANLVNSSPLFSYETLAIDSSPIMSDLGIEISADAIIDETTASHKNLPKILIICGGFRCSTDAHPTLSVLLKEAAKQNVVMGGIWNGAIALAHAGLLDQQNCAVHPDNHAFMRERFPLVTTSNQVFVSDKNRLSCAGPVSALEMMLYLIGETHGKAIVRAIREILSCDQLAESSDIRLNQITDDPCLPEKLRDLMALMAANIEEPISAEELSEFVGISRRQTERLFQHHLETSPSRYYLELRITHARRLLLQTNDSITNIALASGFVSTSHFSNCYKDYFGVSPTLSRESR
ncbi:GlxA family transcriptional regulator [Neptunomonas sp.]|uniref:GlxA family transcriptional regulator n=1 Tax=Neptunomonas sp. TaxID=1971898 RepID=UPI002600076A|nr:GlxA family transcriptional regulator [Neptunomonas sp.]